MFVKWLYYHWFGILKISLEGFFINRFLNLCNNEEINIMSLERENGTYIKFEILKKDFKKIRYIAKKTKCKVKIENKIGLPFLLNKYKRRKVFAVALSAVAFFIVVLSNFIWDIEVTGCENILAEEVVDILDKKGISIGKFNNGINFDKIENEIKIENPEIAWIGIDSDGTKINVKIKEALEIPKMIDENVPTNIVAIQDARITKLLVRNGTARVTVGQDVKKGDILVEGVMEGKYKGVRDVHADADITGVVYVEKEKTEMYNQESKIKTGNVEKSFSIIIKKNKINFDKRVSKFKKYDTIRTNNKIKLFSKFLLPIDVEKTVKEEYILESKTYSKEELEEKIVKQLEENLEVTYNISKYDEKNKIRDVMVNELPNGLSVKLTYEIQIEIGSKVAK
jgi:similar to stage IV sporulation protein